MNENFDEFDKYVLSFDMSEKMIEYKYNHTYRVVHQAEQICYDLDLMEEDKELASLIALLHDFARFEQWTKYNTFSDLNSYDHGDRAVELLFDEGMINNFVHNKEEENIIKLAIKYHNKKDVAFDEMNEREKLHCKIIRDADKLDILYAFSTNRLLELEEDDTAITQKVHDDFMNGNIIDKKDINGKNDNLLVLIGFANELFFDYSKSRVIEEEYLNKMYNHLKNKKLFKEYFDKLYLSLKGGI